MRDIRHENINMFIGACTEPGNILIVTQYTSKGSLQVSYMASKLLPFGNYQSSTEAFPYTPGFYCYLHQF